jgi:hypothetical protein
MSGTNLEALMREHNTKTMHEIEAEREELSGADDVIELGDVGDTKGGFGFQGDGHGGFFNPV